MDDLHASISDRILALENFIKSEVLEINKDVVTLSNLVSCIVDELDIMRNSRPPYLVPGENYIPEVETEGAEPDTMRKLQSSYDSTIEKRRRERLDNEKYQFWENDPGPLEDDRFLGGHPIKTKKKKAQRLTKARP